MLHRYCIVLASLMVSTFASVGIGQTETRPTTDDQPVIQKKTTDDSDQVTKPFIKEKANNPNLAIEVARKRNHATVTISGDPVHVFFGDLQQFSAQIPLPLLGVVALDQVDPLKASINGSAVATILTGATSVDVKGVVITVAEKAKDGKSFTGALGIRFVLTKGEALGKDENELEGSASWKKDQPFVFTDSKDRTWEQKNPSDNVNGANNEEKKEDASSDGSEDSKNSKKEEGKSKNE